MTLYLPLQPPSVKQPTFLVVLAKSAGPQNGGNGSCLRWLSIKPTALGAKERLGPSAAIHSEQDGLGSGISRWAMPCPGPLAWSLAYEKIR